MNEMNLRFEVMHTESYRVYGKFKTLAKAEEFTKALEAKYGFSRMKIINTLTHEDVRK